ncbi:MAG: ABC transporter substrate-binding protein [Prevotellaceae bacterium]|jgi:iron complex transport system substrate-binding protein|nr:ABC transporter substrate-binding protein [Prevotellaceae bacterium]
MNRIIIICLSVFLYGCAPKTAEKNRNTFSEYEIYKPKYAHGFSLYRSGDTTVLKVTDPWQFASDVEFNYFLTPNASPNALNEIKIPVTKAVCMSTTHVAFISALDRITSISGVSGLRHVSDSAVIAMSKENKVVDVGYDSNLSYELVFSLMPDVVFAYGVKGEFATIEKKLNELGVKVVYFGEYMEDTPLGKAEWIVAMSAFFGEQQCAVKIFEQIESNYINTAKLLNNIDYKPKVMFNVPYKDTWYLPGTNSYMVKFVNDAGAEYIYPANKGRNSLPMSIEKAYSIAHTADFWLIGNTSKSLDDLKNTDPRMSEIPAFKNKKVFNSNLRANDYGDDFWESGIVKPDIILKDLIKIFHSELLPYHEFYYYRHLK